jgi:hypothetical protein
MTMSDPGLAHTRGNVKPQRLTGEPKTEVLVDIPGEHEEEPCLISES